MKLKDLLQKMRAALGSFTRDGEAVADWEPFKTRRRVEIMVTGDPSRVGAVADAMDEAQKQLFAGNGDAIELRITGFLDNCIHRSRWSKKPFKAAAQARRWQCEQAKTRFADAFADSRGEMLDDLVIIGDRFDDRMEDALRQVEHLKEQGVRVHCFHTGKDLSSQEAYEKLATESGGVFMRLEGQSSIAEVMPILMAHLNDRDKVPAVEAGGNEAQKLKRLLTQDDEENPELP